MPVKASVKDRVQVGRGLRIRVTGQDVVELVRIFPRHMPERQGGEAVRQSLRQFGLRHGFGNTRKYMSAVLPASRSAAVGAWARITP